MFEASEILISTCCVTHLYTRIATQQILPLRHQGTKCHEDFVNLSVFASLWLKSNNFLNE